jgi:CheY-like chemotaxis protein
VAHIVVIEDNFENGRLARRLLRRAGHEVTLSDTGEKGLLAIIEQNPDLVLIDLGLPDIDGQTVIAVLRQHEALQTVRLIAFTSYPEATAKAMAQAYGCDGVITKPINTRTFAAQIEAFLAQTVLRSSPPAPPVTNLTTNGVSEQPIKGQ